MACRWIASRKYEYWILTFYTDRPVAPPGYREVPRRVSTSRCGPRHEAGPAGVLGACDALQTPRPLGPLFDIAAHLEGELLASLQGGERSRIFGDFLAALAKPPALVVLEDLHWADEATLDFLRYVGRRIGRTHSLLVASFRNDEVGPAHPLRVVLADLATSGASGETATVRTSDPGCGGGRATHRAVVVT